MRSWIHTSFNELRSSNATYFGILMDNRMLSSISLFLFVHLNISKFRKRKRRCEWNEKNSFALTDTFNHFSWGQRSLADEMQLFSNHSQGDFCSVQIIKTNRSNLVIWNPTLWKTKTDLIWAFLNFQQNTFNYV